MTVHTSANIHIHDGDLLQLRPLEDGGVTLWLGGCGEHGSIYLTGRTAGTLRQLLGNQAAVGGVWFVGPDGAVRQGLPAPLPTP